MGDTEVDGSDRLTLDVSELFYSLQGEGSRTGDPSMFVRLQGCSAKHACYESGVRCDTEFESGKSTTVEALAAKLEALQPDTPERRCQWIVWTGGEPLDQLTIPHLKFFQDAGYLNAVETSGLHALEGRPFHHVTVSPKVAEHVLEKNFPGGGVTELKYVRHAGQEIPRPKVAAKHYYLQPHSDGMEINRANLRHCIRLCLENPPWSLSVQNHKVWRVL
jgi:7-carboxy-7-deazaguanine synthase